MRTKHAFHLKPLPLLNRKYKSLTPYEVILLHVQFTEREVIKRFDSIMSDDLQEVSFVIVAIMI